MRSSFHIMGQCDSATEDACAYDDRREPADESDQKNALVLAQEGRGRCPQLDQILDQAGFTGRNYAAFTPELRERIVRHYDDCDICQHCPICSVEHEKLIVPYMPVLIPILFAADFRDRIA